MKERINSIIERYAQVYKDFEELQDSVTLPKGDQKTGVIAEYYAKCYIEKTFRVTARFSKPKDSHDLYYFNGGQKIKVQVKGVSVHSRTRIVAPLNLGKEGDKIPFDFLYLISLDENLLPDGFYINSSINLERRLEGFKDKRKRIVGASMKGNKKKGHKLFDFTIDLKDDLLVSIKENQF